MRLSYRPDMRVLMMAVMDMGVLMLQIAVTMIMFMSLRQMQP